MIEDKITPIVAVDVLARRDILDMKELLFAKMTGYRHSLMTPDGDPFDIFDSQISNVQKAVERSVDDELKRCTAGTFKKADRCHTKLYQSQVDALCATALSTFGEAAASVIYGRNGIGPEVALPGLSGFLGVKDRIDAELFLSRLRNMIYNNYVKKLNYNSSNQ